jgi:phosphatidylinositol glycan class O
MEKRRSRGRGGRVILVFLFCCHVVSFLVFCKGFMLKRVVIPEYSSCTHPHNTTTGNGESCNLYPRPFKRVLWLLVDALRYDFAVYQDEQGDHPLPVYRNRMPYIRDLLQSHPENARLFKFVADPPTTTMQRLKALTTGSLPTFIDIGSNFNSYAVSEDSLPYQAKQNCRNVTFIGDDTWLGLYPGMLTKVFDYPSLNVQDLDTVDNGVKEKLGPELAKGDAELVIGHMLGVDHVGHTYGPSHWTMGKKLTEMNEFIQ